MKSSARLPIALCFGPDSGRAAVFPASRTSHPSEDRIKQNIPSGERCGRLTPQIQYFQARLTANWAIARGYRFFLDVRRVSLPN